MSDDTELEAFFCQQVLVKLVYCRWPDSTAGCLGRGTSGRLGADRPLEVLAGPGGDITGFRGCAPDRWPVVVC